MPQIVLVLTKHAKEKMIIHGISKEQIKIAIERGGKVQQTDGFLASYTYIKIAYSKSHKLLNKNSAICYTSESHKSSIYDEIRYYKKTEPFVYKIKTVFVG